MFLKFLNVIFPQFEIRYVMSFLKHYHIPVIHFGILHFKNEETLFHSAGPISRYSQLLVVAL